MNNKLRCLLLDDELPGLKYLQMLCGQLIDIEVVKSYSDVASFLEDYTHQEFDFCLMDIEMPDVNGIELAKMMKGYPIIFATAYNDYALEAFDANAIDYITKPIQIARLRQAIDKVRNYITDKATFRKFTYFNTDKGKAITYFEDILYVQSSDVDGRDKVMFLRDGSRVVIKNINFHTLLKVLPAPEFIRINKKEIIAFQIIKFFSSDEIIATLADAQGKPISFTLGEAYRKGFLKAIQST